jgi:GT2 family glycosyltransferase
MNIFTGKKALCFIALPHHNRFLVPIMEGLKGQGMEIVYFTAAAEGAFEITLNQAGLPYRHLFDYADAETTERTNAAFRELRPVLQGKILNNRVLQAVPVVIQDKVNRGVVENYFCTDRMLKIEKPDLLFALHELNPWGKILGHLSHVHRIPYFTLQEGLYYADLHYYRFHTDYSTACVVWGEECREILMKAGCGDDKIFPLGNTHIWDAKKEFTEPTMMQATRKTLGIAPGKKVILFLMSHSHYRRFEAQPFLRWMKERGDVVAVFKWHPVTNKEIVDQALSGLQGQPSIINVHDVDTYALIGLSDVCVTVGNSTTGLEALVFGKPLVEVRLPDQPYSYSQLGVADQAFGFEDLGAKIETLLLHGLPETTAANVERYLAHNFSYRDNRTMERIVELAGKSLMARAEEQRAPLQAPSQFNVPCTIVLPVDNQAPQALLATLNGICTNLPPELYEVVIVNCASGTDIDHVLASLGGDVNILTGDSSWSYSSACNLAVTAARGKYLAFLKPGLVPEPGWLEGLLEVAEENDETGVVGGQVLSRNGMLWHIGVAFDVNQSPFSIYRFMPREFSGALKQREFDAVEFPFLVSCERFCRAGGFNPALRNRFEDVDFCLSMREAGLKIHYTPRSAVSRQLPSWAPSAEQEQSNCIHFYSKWTGRLWQNDGEYLRQDGLTHEVLSALYRDLASRIVTGVKSLGHDASVSETDSALRAQT